MKEICPNCYRIINPQVHFHHLKMETIKKKICPICGMIMKVHHYIYPKSIPEKSEFKKEA